MKGNGYKDERTALGGSNNNNNNKNKTNKKRRLDLSIAEDGEKEEYTHTKVIKVIL